MRPRLTAPVLVAFAGLPGVGKSTIALRLARQLRAVYLRIDTVEAALAGSALAIHVPEDAGYAAAIAVAADNLALGHRVVGDSVNPVAESRAAWRAAAARTGASILEVEVVCADTGEHARRVAARHASAPSQHPRWSAVLQRAYTPFPEATMRIDTAGEGADDAVARIVATLAPNGLEQGRTGDQPRSRRASNDDVS
ncbi:AAA family ATPase [Acuticoccus sp.]|uniref:AAA family ATPase n=1 Tax=Acuticoccus sp. TaxID=1904378 RepID=UPI003B52800A